MSFYCNNLKKILIVKTSSLGDIIQSLHVLDYLHSKFPHAEIDWVVEASHASVIAAHPFIHQPVVLDLKGLKTSWSAWKKLFFDVRRFRKKKYDVVFDLQRNCKSGFITWFAKSSSKVGFGRRTVREWPNLLATNIRFDVDKTINIRLQYLALIQKHLKDDSSSFFHGIRFNIEPAQKKIIQSILADCSQKQIKIMVCPGSKWINKQLPLKTMIEFLKRVQNKLDASFFLMWGDASEQVFCKAIETALSKSATVVDRLEIPTWQNLMNEMQLVIALDSSALHLCGTSKTPSFSLFGPTMPQIFKPIGEHHGALRGACPYKKTFEKACPFLRTCPSGSCIRDLSVEKIYAQFDVYWETLIKNKS